MIFLSRFLLKTAWLQFVFSALFPSISNSENSDRCSEMVLHGVYRVSDAEGGAFYVASGTFSETRVEGIPKEMNLTPGAFYRFTLRQTKPALYRRLLRGVISRVEKIETAQSIQSLKKFPDGVETAPRIVKCESR